MFNHHYPYSNLASLQRLRFNLVKGHRDERRLRHSLKVHLHSL